MTAIRRRALVHGLTAFGLLYAVYVFVVQAPRTGTFGFDAFAYWSVSLRQTYAIPLGALGSFPYTPPVALLFDLFGALPWSTFVFAWACLGIGTIIWLGRRWSVVLFAFPPVAIELYHGNIHLFLAAAIALGFRYPAAWAFVLLTKPTSGIGLLWFLARGEWRSLGIALGTTGLIAAISLPVAPNLWAEWLVYLSAQPAGMPGGPSLSIPLPIRLAVAAAVVLWGARTERAWTVSVAATIALPVLWYAGFSVLIAAAPGLRAAARGRSAAGHLASPRDGPVSGHDPMGRLPALLPATIAEHVPGSAP